MKHLFSSKQSVTNYSATRRYAAWGATYIRLGTILAWLGWLLAQPLAGRCAPLAGGPGGGGASPSLAAVLNPDGTLRAGAQGSFDARQFTMRVAPNGQPLFSPTQTKGAGDQYWQDGFGLPGANGQVQVVVQAGPNIYIGGQFTSVGSAVANRVAKWDGTSWSSLGTGAANGIGSASGLYVNALAVLDNNVYIGGSFPTAGGTAANNIARWNGTSWSSLGAGTANGTNNAVNALAAIGSSLYVGGGFGTAGGITARSIARWDGSNWNTVGTGTENGVAGSVVTLAAAGASLYVGGSFARAGSVAANSIARWDGNSWNSLGTGTANGLAGTPYALAVSGNDLYVTGYFARAGGITVNNIAKWDGIGWSGLGTGLGSSAQAVAVVGSSVYVGGSFGTAGGVNTNYLARWDGTSWSSLNNGSLGVPYPSVSALAGAGNSLLIGGTFAQLGGVGASSIGRYDGTNWSSLGGGNGANGSISAVAVAGTTVYVGGGFTRIGGVVANGVARWNGTSWSSLGTNAENGVYDNYNTPTSVSALAVVGTSIYVGGSFVRAGTLTANHLAQWDGTSWSRLGSSTANGVGTRPAALATIGTDLYVGGDFFTAGNVPATFVAKWDGTTWSALTTATTNGLDGPVRAMAVAGTDLYVGGSFGMAGTTAGGMRLNSVAKWNGTSWSSLGTGAENGVGYYVSSLATEGQNVYVGGSFTTAGTKPANYIAKWDGTSWSSLGTGLNSAVGSIAVVGTSVYAAGTFTTAGGATVNNVAKWDGTSWSSLGTGLNSYVAALGIGADGTIIAGGNFTAVGDNSKTSRFFGIYNDVPRTILNSLSPTSGAIGSVVQLTGVNLAGATGVSFNGTAATALTNNTATGLTVTVPAGATTGSVTVTTALGTSNGLTFTVLVVPLTITALSPVANARAAARTSPVQITFNQALAASSAGALKVYSAQRGGLRTRGTTPAVVGASTLTYAPPAAQPFMPGETVLSIVTTAASSSANIALARPRVQQFTAAVGGTGKGSFSGGSDLTIGAYNGAPDGLALGDIDNDGDLDMLSSNGNYPGTVSVRVNNGSGTFSGSQNVAVGSFPSKVALVDLDGDGDLDMLSLNNAATDGTVSARLNNGSGLFSGGSEIAVGNEPSGLTVGDWDGDGDLDFATANNIGNTVSVRLNNGAGVFSVGSEPAVSTSPETLTSGDVDGDGDLDLLVSGIGTRLVDVLLNNGSGAFTRGTGIAVGVYPYSIALADVDGDGDLDLLTANNNLGGTGSVSVRFNNGTGAFAGSTEILVGDGPRTIAVGDLDADGDLDFVTSNVGAAFGAAGTTVSVRLNSGAGAFAAPATNAEVTVGSRPWYVALGDVDGDGDLDFLSANNANTVSIRLNGSTAPLPPPTPAITSFTPGSGPVGTTITVTGTNLTGTTAVKLNGVTAGNYNLLNDNTLTLTVPASATSGLITVVTPGGTATSASSFTVTVPNPVPTLSNITPSRALVNSGDFTLTVSGSGFVSGAVVNFLRGPVPTTFVSGTQLTAVVPNAMLDGIASFSVTVTNPTPGGGTSAGLPFEVYLPAPTITSFTPSSGPVGTTVTVTGTNFQLLKHVGLAVPNNPDAAYTVLSPTTLTFTVPAGSVSGPVGINTSAGTATSATSFTVIQPSPAPVLSSLSPATAVAGSSSFALTVSGLAFTPSSVITFNGVALPTTYGAATQLTAQVPASAVASAGTYGVAVSTPAPGGGTSASLPFSVTVPAPTIAGFTPPSGPVGTVVTVTGSNFTSATAVTLNGIAVPVFTVLDAATLTFVVPASTTSGLIAVTTPGGTATSATAFNLVLAAVGSQPLPGLEVYPNPFQRVLTVQLPAPGKAQVALYDATGRRVLAPQPLPANGQLELPAGLATGSYWLEVRQNDQVRMKRLTKE